MLPYILLSVTGLIAGVLGGMLGIGGSIIMLPAMVWILGARDAAGKEQIQQYMAVAMIVNFLLSVPSVAAHMRNKAVWPKVALWMGVGALVGVVLGVQLSWLFKGDAEKYLRYLLGVFFAYVAVDSAWRLVNHHNIEGLPRERVEAGSLWARLALGFPIGTLAGLTGIGGGALTVPAQQVAFKVPLRNAIANSSVMIVAMSWLGAILKNCQIDQAGGSLERSFVLTAFLAPTAMIGSYFGGHLTHTLPLRLVRLVFTALIIVSSWKMFTG